MLFSVNAPIVELLDEAQCLELDATLVERIYEFNSEATGYTDGQLLGGCVRADSGELIAGFSGHTWGGVCVITHLWVDRQYRGRGMGQTVLQSAEAEARRRNCAHLILATHSFQRRGSTSALGTSAYAPSKTGLSPIRTPSTASRFIPTRSAYRMSRDTQFADAAKNAAVEYDLIASAA